MSKSIVFKLCLIAVASQLTFTACRGNGTPTPSGAEQGETPPAVTSEATSASEDDQTPQVTSSVIVLVATPITSLDPYRMVTLHPDGSMATHVWDCLIWLNDDLQLEPQLAESWRLINNLTWEFTLRQDVTFHNDEPFNADAVRFSIERAQLHPHSLETFVSDAKLDRVEIVDDYTIRLHTKEPVANLPYYLTSLEILPPGYYGESNMSEVVKNPVGSGPYRFVEQREDGRITLEAVSDYWAGPPEISTIIFQPVPSATQRVAQLAAGQANLVTDLSLDQATAWDDSWGRLETIESTRRIFIGIRTEDGTPLADKRVRQALNYAVDVDAIVEDLLGGYAQAYGSWVNPPHGNPNLEPWPYDVDKAQELLAQAGYAEGFAVYLDTPNGRYHQDQVIAQRVAEQLGQVGITVEVRPYDWSTYLEDYLLTDRMAPLFLLGFHSRGNDIEDTNNLSFSFPFNLTKWQNGEFEQLLKEARSTFNERQRQELLNQAQAIAYDEAPWIWLWRQYDFYGISDSLNWHPRADGLVYLYSPAR